MARVRVAMAAAQRRWWLAVLLVLLVAAGSLVQYVGAGTSQRDSYVATRSLRIVVVPIGASTAYDGYIAARQEGAIAQALATGGLLSGARLDEAIAASMRADQSAGALAAHDIAAALSTTYSGNLVTFTARGRTSAEADAIATATVETLCSGALASLLPSALVPPSDDALLVQVEGNASQPARDTAQNEAAVWQIVTRVALAFAVGVLLTLLLGWWMSLRPRAHRLA